MTTPAQDHNALVLTELHPSGYAVLTLNRPQAMNALSKGLMTALAEAVDAAAANPAVRVLIITGAGKAFTAGLDLKEIGAGAGSIGGRHRRQAGGRPGGRHSPLRQAGDRRHQWRGRHRRL
jgi:enoyl-CoA hydratase/carnithine racemase